MRLLIMGGFKFWVVTIILQLKILRLQLLGGYYYATVTITGITVHMKGKRHPQINLLLLNWHYIFEFSLFDTISNE